MELYNVIYLLYIYILCFFFSPPPTKPPPSKKENKLPHHDDDVGGAIEVEEFLMGCLRLRGSARAMDMAKLCHDQAERLVFSSFESMYFSCKRW